MTTYDLERTSKRTSAEAAETTRRRTGGPATTATSIARRALLVAVAYVLVTASLLAGLLYELRQEAIGASKRELGAFAQLAAQHTFEVMFDLEQRLKLAEVTLSLASGSDSANQEAIGSMLREVVGGARSLKDILVLDARGRAVFQANGTADIGLDWSDRSFFQRIQKDPALKFALGTPARRDQSFIPVTLPWRRANGEFAGAVVGLMDPRYFDSAWTFDAEIAGLSIALATADGKLIARRPQHEAEPAQSATGTETASLAPGQEAGTLETMSAFTGRLELQAHRRIAAYPDLVVQVAQPIDVVLAGWRQIAWISASCWVLASLALGGLGAWLSREMQAREALQRRYHALFNSIPQAVIVSDCQSGQVLACNDAAIEQYGWPSPGDAQVRLSQDFAVLSDDMQAFSRDTARFIRGQRHRNAQGAPIDVELTVRKVDVDGRPALLTVAADVSDRVGAERAQRVAEEQLRQSQKMDTLGQLTGGIAHDFNNVLMVVMDGIEELEEKPGTAEDVRRALGRIADAARRAEELTRKMLAFSRKQPLRPRATNVNDLVADTGKLLRRTLGEQIEIDSILADEVWPVEIDAVQLETSLVNLCLNARDAMPEGGRLVIETANVTLGRAESQRHSGLQPGDYVLVTVRDTGHGIPTQHLDKIFEPFFTTKVGGKSSGLGLSMVYGFVKQSNGHIEVESRIDHGTVFRIHLPRHAGTIAGTDRAEPAPARGGDERVLVVEDDPPVRASVVRQLRSLGYAVSEADSGEAGLAACEAAAEPFDLVLTDVVMPGSMNGKALAHEVARRWPEAAILFMSGYSANVLGDAADDLRLLSKPFRKNDLATAVRTALDKSGAAR